MHIICFTHSHSKGERDIVDNSCLVELGWQFFPSRDSSGTVTFRTSSHMNPNDANDMGMRLVCLAKGRVRDPSNCLE